MRALALAVAFGVGMSFASVSTAEPWTDPNGNLTFNAPSGWTVRPRAMQGGSVALAFTPSSDCYFFGIPNPASANSSVTAARHTTAPLTPEAWATATQGVPDFFTDGPPTVTSQSVDTSGYWPVQRAQLQSGSHTVFATLQVRPGVELRGFCSGSQASYDAILNTLGHPNDQIWAAQGATEDAAHAAGAQQAQEQPAPAAPARRQRRERGVSRGDSSGNAPPPM